MCMGGPVPGWCGRARMPRAHSWLPASTSTARNSDGPVRRGGQGGGGSVTRVHVACVGILALGVTCVWGVPRAIATTLDCTPRIVANDTTNATNELGPIAGTALVEVV